MHDDHLATMTTNAELDELKVSDNAGLSAYVARSKVGCGHALAYVVGCMHLPHSIQHIKFTVS